jgi:hypothetical protein
MVSADALAQRSKPLFVVLRSKNKNEIHFDVNVSSSGKIDPEKPVEAYWILAAKNGSRKELTAFDRKAYGFQCGFNNDKGTYRLEIKFLGPREIELRQEGNDVRARLDIENKPAYLKQIFIDETEAFPVPKVHYIELYGEDRMTGKKVYEKINTKLVPTPQENHGTRTK